MKQTAIRAMCARCKAERTVVEKRRFFGLGPRGYRCAVCGSRISAAPIDEVRKMQNIG